MLEALEKLDRFHAARVLSLAAQRLLPRPGDDHTPDQADQAAAAELIKELSKKAVSRRPQAEVDTVAIQEALSREISSYLFSGVDSAEVRARVGDKGALSPLLYKVSFSPKFENGVAFWGLSKNYVLKAISNCDQVQHFTSMIEVPNAPPHSSLFTQIPLVKRDQYTILVRCHRLGDQLLVEDAYRIYHDELDLVGTKSPLDILKRFIDKFGDEVEVQILNPDGTEAQPAERSKLFHEVIYNVPRGGFVVNIFPNQTVRIGPTPDPVDWPCELALCYAVNYQRYVDQLMRHGVKAEIPKGPLSGHMLRNVRTVP
jgi:hypothetical protein